MCGLLASDAGYGFAVKLKELYARNRKGKSVLKVPENALVLPAQPIGSKAALAIFVNNDGEVLALPAEQIEEMSAGKGQNLFGIPGKKSSDRDEYLVAMAVVAPGEVLTVYSGQSAPMKLKFEELKQFQDKKGQRRQRILARLQAGRPAHRRVGLDSAGAWKRAGLAGSAPAARWRRASGAAARLGRPTWSLPRARSRSIPG